MDRWNGLERPADIPEHILLIAFATVAAPRTRGKEPVLTEEEALVLVEENTSGDYGHVKNFAIQANLRRPFICTQIFNTMHWSKVSLYEKEMTPAEQAVRLAQELLMKMTDQTEVAAA